MSVIASALVVLAVIGGSVLVLLIGVTLLHGLVCLSGAWLTWLEKHVRWLR